MESVDRGISNSFAVITLALFLGFISIMFGAAYKYADYKIAKENPNISLVRSGADILTEDEQYTLYTGRTRYSTAFGDEVETNMHIEGDTYITVDKNNIDTSVYKSGEAATGAAVWTEVRSLPASVSTVTINGHSLYNDVSQADQQTIDSHINIAYYIKRGLVDDLIDECSIGFTQNYIRSYQYDSQYNYIIGVTYTPI